MSASKTEKRETLTAESQEVGLTMTVELGRAKISVGRCSDLC
ncbi:uncharacterized protein METZ01_LOCUS513125 [marine metagenome]|jgi:hypothetical protein|uniref:Uncharacterized protein n=1 Tax=marine metagenome TaxID=408172 RepID=A0A383EU28_9ZZZZ